ncbi:hypothetical protein BV898_10879 [Hypsibius exemplaris]|uniref:Uncharacterized protein n=1 Tax=Hypsibius exemplaris TaxID=2072580 RepID=A0A1W0WIE1_HYPEX|nr:hypothetical protein BV898_10879 [Hypsibius exemplaris]
MRKSLTWITISILLACLISLAEFMPTATAFVLQDSQSVNLQTRSKRQSPDLTSLIIAGARDILNSGGGEAIRNSPDKTSALMSYVKQFAVRKVLGDGVVGQVLGRGLFGQNAVATTTQPSVGFFNRLFGGGATSAPSSNSKNSGDSHPDDNNGPHVSISGGSNNSDKRTNTADHSSNNGNNNNNNNNRDTAPVRDSNTGGSSSKSKTEDVSSGILASIAKKFSG